MISYKKKKRGKRRGKKTVKGGGKRKGTKLGRVDQGRAKGRTRTGKRLKSTHDLGMIEEKNKGEP